MRMKKRRGFTIVELITVIAILLLLVGAITTSVAGAHRRAKIQQAITEAQQLTDAILAYENYSRPGKPSPLEDKKTGEVWDVANVDKMAFVLGLEQNPNRQDGSMPVLYNGAVTGDSIRDPWGHPYRYRIMSTSLQKQNIGHMGDTAFAFPNINRIPADEVN